MKKGMSVWKGMSGKKKTAVAIVSLAGICILGTGVFWARNKMSKGQPVGNASVQEASAASGDIANTITGTGSLEADDSDTVKIPSGITIKEVKVESGDAVSKGDVLAVVEETSVLGAMEEVQEQIEETEEDMNECKSDTETQEVTAKVSGRIKKNYVQESSDVAQSMVDNGALMLLSLDGKMAADFTGVSGVAAGDTVTVTLSDGTVKEGSVESVSGADCTVTFACDVEYMSGDDSLMERSRILDNIKTNTNGIILVATQVIEAGVDIDMDIGYKNISKLDSEEQFMGRINRSCLRDGEVYFFKLDEGKNIYRDGDIRVEKRFTLEDNEMKDILLLKKFPLYYEKILDVLKRNRNDSSDDRGLDVFFKDCVGTLNWSKVKTRMQLIEEDKWSMSVYLARKITDVSEGELDGEKLWQEYVHLLGDFAMDYAEKRVKLSEITSKMNGFIYQIKRNPNLIYNDKVGEIFYIEDGEKYFEDGKLNRQKLQGEIGEFVDFI